MAGLTESEHDRPEMSGLLLAIDRGLGNNASVRHARVLGLVCRTRPSWEPVLIRNRMSDRRPRDIREEMITETSAFLTWALQDDRGMPRIPSKRLDRGGFSGLLSHPGARAAVRHWWGRVLGAE